ncbi:TetR/AcrR family transcriptional regulator [Acinetobacter pittii]|uniref:TetR/AcrR family transcriptional regulator n=1 Tax=Acinetobacter pittii TaxID=48296 RepID=UPI0034CEFA9D
MADYRNKLIMGLAQVFEQENKPLFNVTISDIVSAAKVSKRTFYEHFNNKEDCFLALYKHYSFHVLSRLIQVGLNSLSYENPCLSKASDVILDTYLQELLTKSNLMNRLYIDILGIDQRGLELRYFILYNFTQNIKRLPFPELEQVSNTELLLFLSGINELVLYYFHNNNFMNLEDLNITVQKFIFNFLKTYEFNIQ